MVFTERTSKPTDLARYRYIVILIVIIIIIYLLKGKSKWLLNLNQINVKGLITYLIVVAIIYTALMKYYTSATSSNSSNKKKLDMLWSIAHGFFYIGLGYFMPNNWGIIAVFQVCWELFEDFQGYGLHKTSYVETDGKKIMDIICNNTGYYLGNLLRRQIVLLDFITNLLI